MIQLLQLKGMDAYMGIAHDATNSLAKNIISK